MSHKQLLSAIGSGLAIAFSGAAFAQEAPSPEAAKDTQQGVIVFTPADFAAARPNTALDLVSRLPGFTLDTGEQVRGFASAAGNVLIDGQRPTVKTESLSSLLERIPIDRVERVELIRGGAPGIDMQGRTVIANVVRKSSDSFQQVLSATALAYGETGKVLPGWDYQATLNKNGRQFEFSLSRSLNYDDSVGSGVRDTTYLGGAPSLHQTTGTEADGALHTAKASYRGPLAGGTLTLNGLYRFDEFKDESRYFSAAPTEAYVGRSANKRGEVGVNYKRPFGEKVELEALALSKLATGESRSTGEDGTESSLFLVNAEAGESIGRSILRYRPTKNLTFEGGGEVAFNYRDQQVALAVNGASVPLPASDVHVEELRGEGFAQAVWRPSKHWTLEAGVRVEESTISQSGDTSLERSFVYPKPRAVITWAPTEKDQVRVRVEREIGQLDFHDFVSNVNLDNAGRVNAGNANLEPDKKWIYEIAFEKRFWDGAAAVLTLRHEDIADVSDLKPFLVTVDANGDGIPDDANHDGQPDQQLVAGPGNIGDGKNDALELSLTLPLKKLGFEGAEFKLDSTFQNSEVTDPLTGEKRRISGQRPQKINAKIRYDMPKRKLTYALGYFGGWSERYYYLQEEDHLWLKNFWFTSVDYKPTSRLTLSAEIDNFDPYKFYIEQRNFNGPRNGGSLDFVRTERRDSQVLFQLSARWQLGG